MDIVFDRGDRSQPKGHALLYFRDSSAPEEVWATYLVILPISVDVAKYVPPFLMNQMAGLSPRDLSAFAFPPAPEKLESYERLLQLAELRDDDVIFAGQLNPGDVPSAMMAITEVVQRYADWYAEHASAQAAPAPTESEETSGVGVNEVLYSLMSDSDKLAELTKLVGRLRFAVEGGEPALARETEEDILSLARHFPEGHEIPRLVQAVKARGSRSARLADLYLQRCFHLIRQEYARLGEVEKEIQALESEGR